MGSLAVCEREANYQSPVLSAQCQAGRAFLSLTRSQDSRAPSNPYRHPEQEFIYQHGFRP